MSLVRFFPRVNSSSPDKMYFIRFGFSLLQRFLYQESVLGSGSFFLGAIRPHVYWFECRWITKFPDFTEYLMYSAGTLQGNFHRSLRLPLVDFTYPACLQSRFQSYLLKYFLHPFLQLFILPLWQTKDHDIPTAIFFLNDRLHYFLQNSCISWSVAK